MSLKYSLVELHNPLAVDEPKKIYARSQVREEIGLYRLAREIAHAASLTEGDVLNVLHALIYKTSEHLEDGDSVCLGGFGTFQYQISSEGVDTREDFNVSKIRAVKVRFRPGKLLRPSLDRLGFERVISVKERREALKKG